MENTDYQLNENFSQDEKRPVGLMVLCILTFIGSGLSLLSNVSVFGMYNMIPGFMETLAENVGGSAAEMYTQSAEVMMNTPRYVFLVMAVPYLISIVGAAVMFAMRRIGFHLYAVAQLLVVFLPQLLSKSGFNFFNLFLAIAFIALYFIFYKKMK